MAAPEFHHFLSLPPELRQEIYMWATPPRFVQVEECIDQDYDDFLDEIRRVPDRLTLDPSLAYFACNWRHKVPHRRQPALESFGFTNSKPQYHPWAFSSSTPEIPIDWLDKNPLIAWEFARNSHFCSNAPIPALLHVCRDSRMSLMQRGYQLAFRTRSSPPCTWFNFSRDFLLVKAARYPESEQIFLSGHFWDLGQFHPGDLQMVRNLAFESNYRCLFQPKPSKFDLDELSPVVQLFSQLSEILFVEWTDEDLQEWGTYPKPARARDERVRRPVEYIDPSFCMFDAPSNWSNPPTSAGQYGSCFVAHKRENGPDASFHQDTERLMGEALAKHMNSLDLSRVGIPVVSWKPPKLSAEHLLSATAYEFLCAQRLKMTEILCRLQERWSSVRKSRDSIAAQSPEEKKEEEHFVRSYWPDPVPHDCTYCDGSCYEHAQRNRIRKWWVEEALLGSSIY